MTAPVVLLQARQIEARIAQIAREIDRHYDGESFVLLVVLKGAVVFAADLMRQIRTPFELEFARSRSYGEGASPDGSPKLDVPDARKFADRHVLVVDDILDTGATYQAIKDWLMEHEALSVRGCFLLDKPNRRANQSKPDFFGFEVPDVFVVGYGLDHAEMFRNLPHIARLPEGET
jgi:hypoxanthine phosphoribosyltransferase